MMSLLKYYHYCKADVYNNIAPYKPYCRKVFIMHLLFIMFQYNIADGVLNNILVTNI